MMARKENDHRSATFTAEIDVIRNARELKMTLTLPMADMATIAILSDFKRQGLLQFSVLPLQLALTQE